MTGTECITALLRSLTDEQLTEYVAALNRSRRRHAYIGINAMSFCFSRAIARNHAVAEQRRRVAAIAP